MIKMLQIGMTVKVLPDAEYGGKYMISCDT